MTEEEELFKEPELPTIHPEDIIEPTPPVAYPEEVTAPPTPAPTPPPVEIEPLTEIEWDSTTSTEYELIKEVTVPYGKVILLKEISIMPLDSDSATYGRYRLIIDGRVWNEKQLGASLTIPHDWKTVVKDKIAIYHRTTDSTKTVSTNIEIHGVIVSEEDVVKVRGYLLSKRR